MYKALFFFIAFFLLESLHAQYINTDSLVLIPGEEFMISINDVKIFYPDHGENILNLGIDGQYLTACQMLANFKLPGQGKVISKFGWRSGRMHTGTDIKMEKGDTIYAAFNGVVSQSGYYYGYGNLVVLEHSNDLETYYAHLSSFLVKRGETISKGQALGLAGSTGRATTNHLHFEIRENKKPYNPELVFDFENSKFQKDLAKGESLASLSHQSKVSGGSQNEVSIQNYRVKNGDSLWKISKLYKTSIQTLCLLNDLTENAILQVGQILKLNDNY